VYRSRLTVVVCLVAIAGGVAIGLMPLGGGSGTDLGVTADQAAGDQADRLRSNERADREPSTTVAEAVPATDAGAPPTAPEGEVAGPGPALAVSSIPTLDWLRRLSPRAAERTALRAAETGDGPAPETGAGDVGVFSWLAPVVGTTPSATSPPPAPTTAPPQSPPTTRPPTTRPPTTLPEVTTTEPEVTTTLPEVTTTEPEVTTTLPEVPVDPPAG
jgi:hypothetical protein